MTANVQRVLLIVGGGIAAYKSLELVRLLKQRGIAVRAILTKGGEKFVTPLSLGALTEDTVYSDLWSLTDEAAMGHIQLSRSADLVVVAPATADILARMAAGLADDLATTALLATDKPVLAAPAMNVRMWDHAATRANVAQLQSRGIAFVGPDEGPMACGEFGPGRMAEPARIADTIQDLLATTKTLSGLTALVTSGPTQEPIDPVRYLGNRSSGRQGHAIATALARLGADVTLVAGPTDLPDPANMKTIRVRTAVEMLHASETCLPVDIAVCAAAVADWRVAATATEKLKKNTGGLGLALEFVENPDVLRTLATHIERPRLVIGFAAETSNVHEEASAKRLRKSCDWIVANQVTADGEVFGSNFNTVSLIREDGIENWPRMSKEAVGSRLATEIAGYFSNTLE